MKAPPFAYARATTLEQAFGLLREAGDGAMVLAGGQSLIPTLAFHLAQPTLLVDISRLPELGGISVGDGVLRIGALTTHAALGADPNIRRHAPLLAEAVPLIAHPAVRNRGTMGGSLAWADPAAELPACCVALRARIVVAGAGRPERHIEAGAFFTGLFTTALSPGELIAAVEVPCSGLADRGIILELTRRHGDYAMVGVAASLRQEAGRTAAPRLVFFGVGPTPVEARRAAQALGGVPWSDPAVTAAVDALEADLDPPGDANGGPATKRHHARVLLRRALAGLAARIGEPA